MHSRNCLSLGEVEAIAQRAANSAVRDNENQKFLWKLWFERGPPVTESQARDISRGELATFQMGLVEQVSKQVTTETDRHFATNTGLTRLGERMKQHWTSMSQSHETKVQTQFIQHKDHLENMQKNCLNRTKSELSNLSDEKIHNILSTEPGSHLMTALDEKVYSGQGNYFFTNFMTSIVVGGVAGYAGYYYGSQNNK